MNPFGTIPWLVAALRRLFETAIRILLVQLESRLAPLQGSGWMITVTGCTWLVSLTRHVHDEVLQLSRRFVIAPQHDSVL